MSSGPIPVPSQRRGAAAGATGLTSALSASPSPSIRYDADDEAPRAPTASSGSASAANVTPLADASNQHARRPTDPSKTNLARARASVTDVAHLKERLRHRDPLTAAQRSGVPSAPCAALPIGSGGGGVGESARRIAEAQLGDALRELERMRAYLRTLEVAKRELENTVAATAAAASSTRLKPSAPNESEERARRAEDRARRAEEALDAEKRRRESAEVELRRARADVRDARAKVDGAEERARGAEHAKREMEDRLERLARGEVEY